MAAENKYIVGIRNAISMADQNTLFSESNNVQLIEACIEYLKASGYKVIKLPKYNYTVKTLDELISFFYNMLELKHPGHVADHRDVAENRTIAKLFIKARANASGLNKKDVLNECAEIIRTIFNHEQEFNFKYKITFRIFGQDKLGWVTDKAIQIMNRGLDIEKEELAEKRREEMIEAQDPKDIGFGDLQEILDKLEKDNGKKERS